MGLAFHFLIKATKSFTSTSHLDMIVNLLECSCEILPVLVVYLWSPSIVNLSECSIEIIPVPCSVFLESFNNLFDGVSDIAKNSFKSVVIGEVVCVGH